MEGVATFCSLSAHVSALHFSHVHEIGKKYYAQVFNDLLKLYLRLQSRHP